MERPIIPAYPPAPELTDSAEVFDQKAFALAASLEPQRKKFNEVAVYVNDVAAEAEGSITVVRQEVVKAKGFSEDAEESAQLAANEVENAKEEVENAKAEVENAKAEVVRASDEADRAERAKQDAQELVALVNDDVDFPEMTVLGAPLIISEEEPKRIRFADKPLKSAAYTDAVGLGSISIESEFSSWDDLSSNHQAGWFKIEDGGEGIPEGNAPCANYGIIMPRHAKGYFSAMFMPYGEQGDIVVRNQHGATAYDHTIWTDKNFTPGPWALGDSNPIIETSESISALPYQTIGIDTSVEDTEVAITLPANPQANQWVSFFDSKGTWGDNNPTILRNGNLIMGLDEDMSIDIMGGNFTLTYLNAERGWVITL